MRSPVMGLKYIQSAPLSSPSHKASAIAGSKINISEMYPMFSGKIILLMAILLQNNNRPHKDVLKRSFGAALQMPFDTRHPCEACSDFEV